MIRAVLILAASVLSGCATAPTISERPLRDRIPPSLLQCAPAPTPGDLARQSDVAAYVVDLGAAGEDCRRKVGGIKRIVEADR